MRRQAGQVPTRVHPCSPAPHCYDARGAHLRHKHASVVAEDGAAAVQQVGGQLQHLTRVRCGVCGSEPLARWMQAPADVQAQQGRHACGDCLCAETCARHPHCHRHTACPLTTGISVSSSTVWRQAMAAWYEVPQAMNMRRRERRMVCAGERDEGQPGEPAGGAGR